MRLLLVEDNDDLREMLARLLKLHGCEVRQAPDAPSALEAFAAFAPELVITDLMMPVMDGVELIRRLRALPGAAGLVIIAMTADCTSEAERSAREAGAADFLVKPIEIAALMDRIRRNYPGS